MSLSVKDRAKMFGALASPTSTDDRSFRRVGNKVSSSPFKTPASPGLGNKVSSSPFKNQSPSPARAPSTPSRVPASPYASNSPRNSIPITVTSSPSLPKPFLREKNADRAPSVSKSAGPWPDEDEIPAPATKVEESAVPVRKFPNSSSPFKVLNNKDHQGRLPGAAISKQKLDVVDSPLKIIQNKEEPITSKSPITNNPSKALQKTKDEKATIMDKKSPPFKVLNNKDHQGRLPGAAISKQKLDVVDDSPLKIIQNKEDSITSKSPITNNPSKALQKTKDEKATIMDKKGSEEKAQPESKQNENKPTITSIKNKSTRAIRLMKARRAVSPSPLRASKSLKQSLEAAKVVLQEEKSDTGASDTSSRSSLSNKELSDIAKRALKRSKNKIQSEFNTNKRLSGGKPPSTLKKSSVKETERQLPKSSKIDHKTYNYGHSGEEGGASERLGVKANRAVAMKNSNKTRAGESSKSGMDILETLSIHSSDHSARSRRVEHPAFAARAGKANVSSAHILASFRQFNATRSTVATKQGQANTNQDMEDELKRTLSGDDSLSSGASTASLEQDQTMHSVSERPGQSTYSLSERRSESMRSMTERLGESTHSSSGRKHADSFNRVGRVHVITRNSCNDTVMSSLSGNTHSVQSIMSQSVASKMKSPKHKKSQNTSYLLDPTPEYSSQTMRSELGTEILSPGPSNRSGRSFANSINSATPRDAYKSPTFRDRINTEFLDTLEETNTISQESNGNSADLLDAALEAAIDDMSFLSPTSLTSAPISVLSKGLNNAISILPSSSARSQSPPGFVFKDSEESDAITPPDPKPLADSIIGEDDTNHSGTEDADSTPSDTTTSNDESQKQDESFDTKAKQVVLETDSLVNYSEAEQNKGSLHFTQGSTSTKQTVSTSIRSGISSIQNGTPTANRDPEGSTSIRTGLSGIQNQREPNDMENSISIHTNTNGVVKNDIAVRTVGTEAKVAEEKDAQNSAVMLRSKYPDTIEEESEVKSSQKIMVPLNDDNASVSVLKLKATETTDGSSGPGTTQGASSSDQMSSDSSGTQNGGRGLNVAPIQTEGAAGEEVSQTGLSLLTSGSRASRPWKTIGNAIKNVLAKASPRPSAHVTTPSNHSRRNDDPDECESLFSDDEDDIFGGLEVEEVVKPLPRRKPKIDDETPKQKNFKTEGSLSYRMNGTDSKRTSHGGTTPSRRSGTPSHKSRTPSHKSRTPSHKITTPSNKITTPSRRSGTPSRRCGTPSHKGGTPRSATFRSSPRTPSREQSRSPFTPFPPNPVPSSNNVPSRSTNDKTGTILDESQIVNNVHSDITSSLIGGPISGPSPFQKTMTEAAKLLELTEEKNEMEASEMEAEFTKEGESFTLMMEETDVSFVERKQSRPVREGIPMRYDGEEDQTLFEEREAEEEDKRMGSMFFNFGCGFVDPCSGFASLCTTQCADKSDDEDAGGETVIGDAETVSSHTTHLTPLEKKVWNEWDRINESVLNPKGADKTTGDDKNENYDKKREAARDKLLDMASSALSSVSGKSAHLDDENCNKTTFTENHSVSQSGSTESGSGNSSATESMGSYSRDSSHGYSTSYSTGDESDEMSDERSRHKNGKTTTAEVMTPTAGPILLSFSQRSLMEKFSKQLTSVGVQVLKLNTRKQWQTRYFTVSNEQIALSAHEAISKTGEMAQCPKALLWLKKFTPKNGGYGIGNIDKNGHGGMLLVDLVDIQVSDRRDDMVGNPIPKKLTDAFENSVLVTLKYKMKGVLRSIEFRCRDNDEAQFLCTCMRVIRDLLRRERSLRQKLSNQSSKKVRTPSSSSRRR